MGGRRLGAKAAATPLALVDWHWRRRSMQKGINSQFGRVTTGVRRAALVSWSLCQVLITRDPLAAAVAAAIAPLSGC